MSLQVEWRAGRAHTAGRSHTPWRVWRSRGGWCSAWWPSAPCCVSTCCVCSWRGLCPGPLSPWNTSMASHRKRAGEPSEQIRMDIDRYTDMFFSKTMIMTGNNNYEVQGGCLSLDMRGSHIKLVELCQAFSHYLIHIHLNVRKSSRKGILSTTRQPGTHITCLVGQPIIYLTC